jgi:repressor LexA
MPSITRPQQRLLTFIADFTARHGYPPTVEEIRSGLGWSTKSLVAYHIGECIAKQLLTQQPRKPRTLRLVPWS